MSTHVHDVVQSTGDVQVAVSVSTRAIARRIVTALEDFEVRFLVSFVRAVHVHENPGPRTFDAKRTFTFPIDFMPVDRIEQNGFDAEERKRRALWLERRRTGKRRDDVSTGFGLPPRVDYRKLFVADDFMIPQPRFFRDRLAYSAQDSQRRTRAFVHRSVTEAL